MRNVIITEQFAIEGDRVFVIDKDMPAVPVENVVYYHGDIADGYILKELLTAQVQK